MPYKDPTKKKEYQRQYMRQQRSGSSEGAKNKTMLDPDQLETAQGLFAVLRHAIIDAANSKMDPAVKGRLIGYLVNVGFKGLELTDFEERLQVLEKDIKGAKK